MIIAALTTALLGTVSIYPTAEELASKLLEEAKRTACYKPSGKNPPRLPGTIALKATFEPTDPSWIERFQEDTGLPVDGESENHFEIGECTWFAEWVRGKEQYDPRRNGRNDAKNWLDLAESQGYSVGRFVVGQPRPLPQLKAILVHKAWPGNEYGHVSIVGKILSEDRLIVWDANFSKPLDGRIKSREIQLDDYVAGYIYPTDWGSRHFAANWLLPNRCKGFGTFEPTSESDGPYWTSVLRLSPDVPNVDSIYVEIYPDLTRALDLDVYVWPQRFTARLPVASKNVTVTLGPIPVKSLPDRYVVVLVKPNRIKAGDKPIKPLLAYVKYSTN